MGPAPRVPGLAVVSLGVVADPHQRHASGRVVGPRDYCSPREYQAGVDGLSVLQPGPSPTSGRLVMFQTQGDLRTLTADPEYARALHMSEQVRDVLAALAQVIKTDHHPDLASDWEGSRALDDGAGTVLDQIYSSISEVDAMLTKDQRASVINYHRELVHSFFLESEFCRHAFTRPLGYPGD